MDSKRQPHILNAASNLIGICFVIIAGLKISGVADHTLADETCVIAAFGFLLVCALSYISMRIDRSDDLFEKFADYIFLASQFLLFTGIVLFARGVLKSLHGMPSGRSRQTLQGSLVRRRYCCLYSGLKPDQRPKTPIRGTQRS